MRGMKLSWSHLLSVTQAAELMQRGLGILPHPSLWTPSFSQLPNPVARTSVSSLESIIPFTMFITQASNNYP